MQSISYRPYSSSSCTAYLFCSEGCSGFLESYYFGKSIPFYNEMDLIFAIDALINQAGGPQEAFTPRSFVAGSRRKRNIRKAEMIVAEDTNKIIPLQAEAEATFVIDVQYRQHSSWQGTITWAEKGETKRFRSVLEMLRLMSDAQPEQERVLWDEEE